MAGVFGRGGPQETAYWAVQLRRGEAANAISGRYLCHEPNATAARKTAARLAKNRGMPRFTVAAVDLPVGGWGETAPPEMGKALEVTNLYLWSRILAGRQTEN